jgi:hydroxymethylpyrimidine/phosphomethylpyrimidine kinase
VLIKGGHLENERFSTDFLFIDGELTKFEIERIKTTATHGTGCTLSSAIAANLALGHDLKESVRISKDFVTEAIRTAPELGKGHSPINHLVRLEEKDG